MKKLFVAACVAVMAMAIAACSERAPKANLDTNIDSLSYAIGMTQTQGLKQYLSERMGIDTTCVDEFIKGVIEGANAGDDKKQAAYYQGITIGQQISNQMIKGINAQIFAGDSTQSISMKNFLAGFITAYKGGKGNMTMDKAEEYVQTRFTQIQQEQNAKQYAKNIEAGKKYQAANAKKEGVVTLKSGVQYKVVKEGTGEKPTAQATVTVKYEGKLVDGTVFDSTEKHGGQPTAMPVAGVIPGWTEVLQLMPVGSVWEVVIPAELAYGANGGGSIEPYSTLIFTIELVSIEKEAPAKAAPQQAAAAQ